MSACGSCDSGRTMVHSGSRRSGLSSFVARHVLIKGKPVDPPRAARAGLYQMVKQFDWLGVDNRVYMRVRVSSLEGSRVHVDCKTPQPRVGLRSGLDDGEGGLEKSWVRSSLPSWLCMLGSIVRVENTAKCVICQLSLCDFFLRSRALAKRQRLR